MGYELGLGHAEGLDCPSNVIVVALVLAGLAGDVGGLVEIGLKGQLNVLVAVSKAGLGSSEVSREAFVASKGYGLGNGRLGRGHGGRSRCDRLRLGRWLDW